MFIPELHDTGAMLMAFPWPVVIPAAISALSGLFGKKAADKQADEKDKMCEAQNQRRAALIGAVSKAYGLDLKGTPELQALAAPRPCPDQSAGSTYSLLSDVLGGGALAAGKALAPDAPCPPGQVMDPVTKQCSSPGAATTANAAAVGASSIGE